MRKLLIKLLCWLLKVKPSEYVEKIEKIIDNRGVKFIDPYTTKDVFDESQTLEEFINKIK